MMDNDFIVEARNIVRRYPGTIALQGITYRVRRGKINVLIGENGAGKSTLMRILAGVEQPDEGDLLLEGNPIRVRNPRDAARHGISIVHQELSILPNLDLAENIFAGREPVIAGMVVDRATQDRRSSQALHRLQKPMAIHTQASQISLGCRQVVEVARALDQGARILILDEPTSALSAAEAGSLFRAIEEVKRAGVTIIYISHRLHELLLLGDCFTVLRSGKIVGEAERAAVSREWIVEKMSGRSVAIERRPVAADRRSEEVLRVDGLSLQPTFGEGDAQAGLHDVCLSLGRGEILGIYGLLGSGRTEFLECLAGLRHPSKGAICVGGADARISSPAEAARLGVCLVPEDRQRDGLFPELSIRENMTLGARKGGFIRRDDETARARKFAADLKISARELEVPVSALSGGNQQKVLIARCLMRSPTILLLDEPTRGVDVGAKAEIYAILKQLSNSGLSIIFTSSEIEETQALADRALVFCQGRIAAEFDHSAMTDEALFQAASPLVGASAVHRERARI